MNPSYSMLYSYILAILASLGLIIMTRYRTTDSGRRVFPDVTLENGTEVLSGLAETEQQHRKISDQQRIGSAVTNDNDFMLPPQADLTNDLIVKGDLTLGEMARLHGSAKASGSINLGSRALVVGNLVSDSSISVGPGAEVIGILHARDNVWLMPYSSVSASVFSARTIYVHEGVRIGKQTFANRGVVYQAPQHIPQRAEETSLDYASPYGLFSEPACDRCRSLLLTFDTARHQWRCMNCGSYQESANSLSPYFWNAQ